MTENISPAPSQSAVVMRGVCTYWKPRSWKKRCDAYAHALRTRCTAPMKAVRGRRCPIERRNSLEWLFLASGYTSTATVPTTSTATACISVACSRPGDSTMRPVTRSAAPVPPQAPSAAKPSTFLLTGAGAWSASSVAAAPLRPLRRADR